MKSFQVDTGGTLTTGLVSYYKLEDVNDFYGSNNLTAVGDASFVAAKINNGVSLDGAGDYLTVNDNASLSITGSLSLSAWIYVESLPDGTSGRWIASKYNNSGNQRSYYFALEYVAGAPALTALFSTTGSYQAGNNKTVAWTPSLNTWYHVACVFDLSVPNIRFYVNGAQQGTSQSVSNNTIYDGTAKFAIGTYFDGATPFQLFDGIIDEVGVWSKALSTTEIADLYNSGSGQTMTDGPVNLKSWNGLAKASIKSVNGLASVKSINGLT